VVFILTCLQIKRRSADVLSLVSNTEIKKTTLPFKKEDVKSILNVLPLSLILQKKTNDIKSKEI
jgi:hypothetical protein